MGKADGSGDQSWIRRELGHGGQEPAGRAEGLGLVYDEGDRSLEVDFEGQSGGSSLVDSRVRFRRQKSARSLSTSPISTIGSCAASVQHPCRTSSEMPLLTEDGDSSLVPLLGSLSSSHAARPFGIKNTRCVVSSAAFFVGLYVLQLPVNGLFDTNPQGLVIPVGRKLLQHNALESLHGEHVGSSGIGSFLGWAMAGIYMGGRLPQIWLNIKRGNVEGLSLFMFIFALVGNSTYVGSILVNSLEWSKIKPNLPWLVDAGGCVLLDAFILIQFIYFNYRNAARKAADIESGCRSMIGAQHL